MEPLNNWLCPCYFTETSGDTLLQASRKWSLSRQPNEYHNSYFQCLNSLSIHRIEEVNTKQDIINLISPSKFLDSLSPSCYNFVLLRNPKSCSEAVALATDFAQSLSWFHQHRYNPEPHHTTTLLDSIPNPAPVEDPLVMMATSILLEVSHIVLVLYLRVYSLRVTVVANSSSGGHKSSNRYRSPLPNRVKRMASPTLQHSNKSVGVYMSGSVAGVPCSKLFVDSGCSMMCIAKCLIPTYAWNMLLVAFRKSSQLYVAHTAQVQLIIRDLDAMHEVAVCDDLEDDALLGFDLGAEHIGKWLLDSYRRFALLKSLGSNQNRKYARKQRT